MDRSAIPLTFTLHYSVYACVYQFTGSNTHNNGNPAGDGQAGDAGEGTRGEWYTSCTKTQLIMCIGLGTDRHNIVQIPGPNSNYPLPYERSTMWDKIEVLHKWFNDSATTNSTNVALAFASAGYYHCFTGCTERVGSKAAMNYLLNNAPASFRGALVRFQVGVYHYICSRNNNFTNRSQKGTITVRS